MQPAAQFTAVMRAPIVRIIDEQSVTFPLLTSSELSELGEIVRAEWRAKAEKNPKGKSFTDVQWFRVFQEIDEAIIPITEIVKRVGTLPGATWVVLRAVRKYGYDETQAAAILDAIPVIDLLSLAETVSRIRFLPKAQPKPDAGDRVNRPLSDKGEPAQNPALTGEPSVSSSPASESPPPG